jgi:hypothetical protein
VSESQEDNSESKEMKDESNDKVENSDTVEKASYSE